MVRFLVEVRFFVVRFFVVRFFVVVFAMVSLLGSGWVLSGAHASSASRSLLKSASGSSTRPRVLSVLVAAFFPSFGSTT